MDSLLTVKDAAGKLKFSISAIYKLIDEKRLPYVDFGVQGKRRCIRFRESDLMAVIEQNAKDGVN